MLHNTTAWVLQHHNSILLLMPHTRSPDAPLHMTALCLEQ
jgi:hypothetical protein